MKNKEFQKWLKSFPDDADIQVIVMHDGGYGGYYGEFEDVDIDPYTGNTEFIDMRGNPFAKGKSYENDMTIYLGDK